jgi:hypothetical protein
MDSSIHTINLFTHFVEIRHGRILSLQLLRYADLRAWWKKGKFRPGTGHEDPEREYSYSSTLCVTSALDGGGCLGGWVGLWTNLDGVWKISPHHKFFVFSCTLCTSSPLVPLSWLSWILPLFTPHNANIHVPGRIRTRNSNKRSATGISDSIPRLRYPGPTLPGITIYNKARFCVYKEMRLATTSITPFDILSLNSTWETSTKCYQEFPIFSHTDAQYNTLYVRTWEFTFPM